MSLFLFWGQEDYNIQKEIEKLKSKLLDSSFKSMNYKIFDNPEFMNIIECCQTTPLMFGNTLTIINCEKYLVGSKASVDDKQLKVLEESLKHIAESVNIVFLCKISRDENKKIDTRKKLYKILSKVCNVKEFPQYRTYQKELPIEIQKIAKEKELSFDSNAVNYLVEQLGANLRLIDSELEKLRIAIYPKKQVKIDDIKKNCVSIDDVFELADVVVAGNKDEAMRQFVSLTEKRHFLEVLAVLQSSMQRYIFIKNYSMKASPAEIGAQLRLHEFIIKKTIEKLRNISLKRLIQIKENLVKAEYKIKSGQIASGEIAIELALLS